MNINTLEYSSSLNKLSEFCDTLDLHNLIKVSTCEMQHTSSLIDLILTNRKNCFKHSHAFETGLSDFHKLVTTCFKNTYEKLQPINIQYRSYKDFQEDAFLSDLQAAPFDHVLDLLNSEMACNKFKSLFDEVVEKHAPLKKKVLRGNQALFMTKELSKEIMVRSRLRNKFNISIRQLITGKRTKLNVINVSLSGGNLSRNTFHLFILIVMFPTGSFGIQLSHF